MDCTRFVIIINLSGQSTISFFLFWFSFSSEYFLKQLLTTCWISGIPWQPTSPDCPFATVSMPRAGCKWSISLWDRCTTLWLWRQTGWLGRPGWRKDGDDGRTERTQLRIFAHLKKWWGGVAKERPIDFGTGRLGECDSKNYFCQLLPELGLPWACRRGRRVLIQKVSGKKYLTTKATKSAQRTQSKSQIMNTLCPLCFPFVSFVVKFPAIIFQI